MPLLDLKTNLKSLKYGQDQPDGGSSGQPYIQTNINTVDAGFNRLRLTKFDDGLTRGGTVGALNAAIVDTLRLSKFFIDPPKGPLFIIKQVGLQLSNPRLEIPKNPANITAGAPDNALAASTRGLLQPTRVYNLGINTLAQIPLNAVGGHIVRHGILPTQSEASKYEAVVTANNESNNNRLVGLANAFYLGPNISNEDNRTLRRRPPSISTPPSGNLTQKQLIIDNYSGGPGSVYGIGDTLIRRFTNTNNRTFVNVSTDLYSENEAGRPLVNNVRQELTYIDPNTGDGAIPNDLGKRNKFSNQNKERYIGGNAYNSKVSKFGAFAGLNAPENNNEEIVKAINLSVYNENYIVPSSIYAGKSRGLYGEPNNIFLTSTFDYALSKRTQSALASGSFIELPNQITNPQQSLFDNTASIANKKHDRYSNLPKLENKNDLTPRSPSSYPGSQGVTGLTSLELPNFAYTSSRSGVTSSYSDIKRITDKLTSPNNVGIYAKIKNASDLSPKNGVLPNSNYNPTYKNGYGETFIVKSSWRNATRELRVGSGRKDMINLTPLLGDKAYNKKSKSVNDLVKFTIKAVSTDNPTQGTWMTFRAYLTDLSDDVSPEWTDVKYVGRGDKFYIYNGFTRKISISFKVAALSVNEMKNIYDKLNFLMGNAMPDYSGNLMRGPLVRMTVGHWIDNQLGKLDSINFKVSQDSPWEIGINGDQLELPHIVEVSLGFTPIGSETNGVNLISEKSTSTTHIAQNNTGRANVKYVGNSNKGQVIADDSRHVGFLSGSVSSTSNGANDPLVPIPLQQKDIKPPPTPPWIKSTSGGLSDDYESVLQGQQETKREGYVAPPNTDVGSGNPPSEYGLIFQARNQVKNPP